MKKRIYIRNCDCLSHFQRLEVRSGQLLGDNEVLHELPQHKNSIPDSCFEEWRDE